MVIIAINMDTLASCLPIELEYMTHIRDLLRHNRRNTDDAEICFLSLRLIATMHTR